MTTGVKFLATTLSVIGGSGVIAPLTLWQAGYIGGTSLGGVTSETQESSVSGTCEVKNKAEFSEIFSGLSITENKYTVITCEKTGFVLKKWVGIFPNDVFDNEDLKEGEKLNMKTVTETAPYESNERYKTTFSSKEIYGTLVGEWGTEEEKSVNKKGSKIYKVKETTEELDPIYLVLPEKENK